MASYSARQRSFDQERRQGMNLLVVCPPRQKRKVGEPFTRRLRSQEEEGRRKDLTRLQIRTINQLRQGTRSHHSDPQRRSRGFRMTSKPEPLRMVLAFLVSPGSPSVVNPEGRHRQMDILRSPLAPWLRHSSLRVDHHRCLHGLWRTREQDDVLHVAEIPDQAPITLD